MGPSIKFDGITLARSVLIWTTLATHSFLYPRLFDLNGVCTPVIKLRLHIQNPAPDFFYLGIILDFMPHSNIWRCYVSWRKSQCLHSFRFEQSDWIYPGAQSVWKINILKIYAEKYLFLPSAPLAPTWGTQIQLFIRNVYSKLCAFAQRTCFCPEVDNLWSA